MSFTIPAIQTTDLVQLIQRGEPPTAAVISTQVWADKEADTYVEEVIPSQTITGAAYVTILTLHNVEKLLFLGLEEDGAVAHGFDWRLTIDGIAYLLGDQSLLDGTYSVARLQVLRTSGSHGASLQVNNADSVSLYIDESPVTNSVPISGKVITLEVKSAGNNMDIEGIAIYQQR